MQAESPIGATPAPVNEPQYGALGSAGQPLEPPSKDDVGAS